MGNIFDEAVSLSESYVCGNDEVPVRQDESFIKNLGKMARVLTESVSDLKPT